MFDFFHKNDGAPHSDDDQNQPSCESHESEFDEQAPSRTTADVLQEFTQAPLPDAVDGLLFRMSMANPDDPVEFSGFERYAARILTEADESRLRSVFVEHPVELRRLNTTGLFWALFDSANMSEEDRALILRVEAALNRLVLVSAALSEDGEPLSASDVSESDCSLLDQVVFRAIAQPAGSFLLAAEQDNHMLSQYGTTGARGGNWDLSTRFAAACEAMLLPFRLEYQFAADAATGCIAIDISTPTGANFPASLWNEAEGKWQSCQEERPVFAMTYALRLCALVASAAFGCGVGVTRAVVTCHGNSLAGYPCLSMEFNRIPFTMGALQRIREGQVSQPSLEQDPVALADMLHPTKLVINPRENGDMQPIEPIDPQLSIPRVPLGADMRPLPEDLRDLLHADVVSDLDVMSEQDPALAIRFREIMQEKDDSLLLTVAQLEDMVAETEGATIAEANDISELIDGTPPEKSLYCENVFARYLTSLVEKDPAVRYRRASDMGQAARSALARIYRDMGDLEAAEAQARTCIEFAPTSAPAYNDLITCYAEEDRYDQIVEVAKAALRVAVTANDITYLFYRLAFAFWQIGQINEAFACYSQVPLTSPMGEAAASELADLIAESGNQVPGADFDAMAVLHAAGIGPLPSVEALEIMGRGVVELTDAGMPQAAAPLASLIATLQRNDILHAVAMSLRLY